MSAVYTNPRIAHPHRVPWTEWFDHHPIPEITGPNSGDPKLLGVEEHLGPQ